MGVSRTSIRKGDPPKNKGGRPKGSVNKLTADMRAVIREAFEKAGGVEYLRKVAKDDPRTFCNLLGRIIPREIELESKGKGWEQLLDETLERARTTPRPSKPGASTAAPQRPASDGDAPGDDELGDDDSE